MGLLKKIRTVNKEVCKNTPVMGTGMGGAFLLDAILNWATEDYLIEGKKGYVEASGEYEKKFEEQADKEFSDGLTSLREDV